MKQEITFVHEPSRIRSASAYFVARRLKQPLVLLVLFALLLLIPFGLLSSYTWLLAAPIAALVATSLITAHYILTSPRTFCGVEMQLSIRDDGIHVSGSDRSAFVGWAGLKEVYPLKKMWAIFVNNSDAVTFIPTDQLKPETLDFMLMKMRESNVKIQGDC